MALLAYTTTITKDSFFGTPKLHASDQDQHINEPQHAQQQSASAVVVSTVKGPPYGDAFPRDSQVPAKIYTQPQPRPQLQNSTAKDSVKLDFENRAAALETENVTCKALVEKLKKDLECEQREHRETRAKLTTSEKERKNAEENLELLRQYYENEYNKVNSDLKDEKSSNRLSKLKPLR
ncbi:hypothetical protein Pelo_8091 [Pelomyxa schiedti]|nr:hypothetical protein Pelo_8091 [Pelomyxa schiedti]